MYSQIRDFLQERGEPNAVARDDGASCCVTTHFRAELAGVVSRYGRDGHHWLYFLRWIWFIKKNLIPFELTDLLGNARGIRWRSRKSMANAEALILRWIKQVGWLRHCCAAHLVSESIM